MTETRIEEVDIDEIEARWLVTCGPCDGGIADDCACPTGDPRSAIWALVDEARRLRTDNERVRGALQKIHDEHARNPWHPDTKYATEHAKNWHDGYVTSLAHFSLLAFEALDPDGWDEHQKDMRAAQGSDADWWERTGNCGKCATVASSCGCDGACGCWEMHGPPIAPWVPPGVALVELAEARTELARTGGDLGVAIREAGRAREALKTINDWATTVHGGTKSPADIWPGLRRAIDEGLAQ